MTESALPPEQVLTSLNRTSTAIQLFHGALHEVNNALMIISGTVEMMSMRQDLPPDVRTSLDRLRAQGTRTAQLLAEVQHYARDDAQKGRVNLVQLVRQTLTLRMFALKRAKISVEIVADEPVPLVIGSRVRLQQALVNLLLNAEHAMTTGGSLRILLQGDGSDAVLKVEDSGGGVEASLQDRLFAPFATSRTDGAAGLGLWVARAIAEAHAGSLDWSVADGRTTFLMRLPQAAA